MLPFDPDYWDLALDVVTYAVDASFETPLRGKKDAILTVITENIFLDELYVTRGDEKFEENLAHEMLCSVPVVCLVAGRGCGKTSALRYAKRILEKRHPSVRTLLFDVKRNWDQGPLSTLNSDNAGEQFRQALLQFAYSELFPEKADFLNMLAWLLAGRPDSTDSFDPGVVTDLVLESNLARTNLDENNQLGRKGREIALRLQFEKNREVFQEALSATQPKLRMVHLVVAAQKLFGFKKIVLIIDNVDRVPGHFQPALMQCVTDGQLRMGSSCTTIIAIRRENVRGVEPRPGEGGDVLVQVSIHEEKHDGLLLPTDGLDLPAFILGKRRAFSGKLYTEDSAESEIVHSTVVSQFLRERVYDLANGSIRSVIGIYHSFLRYLIELGGREGLDISANLSDEGFLQTLLLLWLRQYGETQGIPLYDVLKADHPGDIRNDYASTADIRHLILTCLFNLSPKSTLYWRHSEFPTVKSVHERLSLLGFCFEDFRAALGDVCARPGEPPKLVEIHPTEADPSKLDELSGERLRLTRLGRALLESTTQKVGYLWARALADAPHGLRKSSGTYFSFDRDERLRIVYHYCKNRSLYHLKLMSFLQESWFERFGNDWVLQYRKYFGVDTKIHLERIIDAAEAFFYRDRTDIAMPFSWLRSRYAKQLGNLAKGIPFAKLDLGSLEGGDPPLGLKVTYRKHG
ncbi:MAG TPA: hypothetical protein VGS22_20080 [Thermoanaerobaculia bacterium]|jgi:hypothetical protein|nr:hypothetical protein [Thermoanaerobaculia bacterium]